MSGFAIIYSGLLPVTRTSAVRLGIPLRQLTSRILFPFGFLLLVVTLLLSAFEYNRLNSEAWVEQQATARTIFETSAVVNPGRNGLAIVSQNRGYERVWVLSATGDIMASNRADDVGHRLDERWWSMLNGKGSGMIQERVRFGEQRLVMTALHNAELGRWVVILARSNSIWIRGLWYFGIILGMSLILWILVATLVGATLKQNISGPLRKLDDRTIELVRGHSVSEAALDRLWAETAPALGGHADCVVDLARRLQSRELLLAETDLRFRSVFDAMPAMALIRDSDSVIVDCNRELADRLDAEKQWITGRNISLMTGILPVTMLEKWFSHADSPKVGVSRMEVFPSEVDEISEPLAISIYPLRHRGKSAHVIIAEKLLDITDLNHPSSQTDLDLEYRMEPDQRHSGDGSSVDIDAQEAEASSSSDGLLSGVLKATGQFVVVFDENAETIFWSPAARLITGVDTLSVGNMKSFTQKIFPNREERRLFKSWIDGAPEKRSQELNIRTVAGTVSSRWYASEIDLQGRGSAGVLWATLDVSVTHKSPNIGEPVA